MKRVLQINVVANTGSTGRIAEAIGEAVLAEGWQSVIAYGRYGQASRSELIRIGSTVESMVHGVETRLLDRHGLGSARATRRLLQQMALLKPDLIQLHNLHGYYIHYPILFEGLAALQVPVVWTLHDCWPITGHCAHFAQVGCSRWKTGCFSCPQKRVYPSSVGLDRSKRNYEDKQRVFGSLDRLTLVPVSDWLEGLLKESFLGSKAMRRIYNGVDTTLFSPEQPVEEVRRHYGLGNGTLLLGVATNWEGHKGLADWVRLRAALGGACQMVLVGLTEGQIRALPAGILGIPRTESVAELAGLYAAADVVLNLSGEESFGLTTVEGFACGTPGIVYDCTASPELISPETGLVVKQGDIRGLVEAVQAIESNGARYSAEACRARALACYRKEDRMAEYLELYRHLLESGAGSMRGGR
jgi:putative colanic acid biosynthesis glycosyltransferase